MSGNETRSRPPVDAHAGVVTPVRVTFSKLAIWFPYPGDQDAAVVDLFQWSKTEGSTTQERISDAAEQLADVREPRKNLAEPVVFERPPNV